MADQTGETLQMIDKVIGTSHHLRRRNSIATRGALRSELPAREERRFSSTDLSLAEEITYLKKSSLQKTLPSRA